MRQFIRHPVDVPVEIGIAAAGSPSSVRTHDISAGGLDVHSNVAIEPGVDVEIRITHVQPAFEAHARVAWCQPHCKSGFELGVTFLDADDAFRARMVEQVCHIEDYRMSVYRRDGRQLTSQEAALEWIAQYAEQFPAIGPDHMH
jgi:hypothetical protein